MTKLCKICNNLVPPHKRVYCGVYCKEEYVRASSEKRRRAKGIPVRVYNPKHNSHIKLNGWRVRKANKGEQCIKCDFPLLEGSDYIYELNMGVSTGLTDEKCWLVDN